MSNWAINWPAEPAIVRSGTSAVPATAWRDALAAVADLLGAIASPVSPGVTARVIVDSQTATIYPGTDSHGQLDLPATLAHLRGILATETDEPAPF